MIPLKSASAHTNPHIATHPLTFIQLLHTSEPNRISLNDLKDPLKHVPVAVGYEQGDECIPLITLGVIKTLNSNNGSIESKQWCSS